MPGLLAPERKDIRHQYERELRGMIQGQTSFEELVEARERLILAIHSGMTDDDRSFLISVKQKRRDWSLIDFPRIEQLPAVKWKLEKLRRMSRLRHDAAVRRLAGVLEAGRVRSRVGEPDLRNRNDETDAEA